MPFHPSLLLALSLLSGLLLTGCGESETPPPERVDLPTLTVVTAPVESALLVPRQELPGTVQAQQRATVSAKVLGTVTAAGFAIGAEVNAGDVLVTLSADELNARVDQARAALDLAAREYEREADLLRQGATAQETVNRLADNRRIAAANLAQIEAQLAYTRITAPFPGVITARHVEPGDLATPGAPLFAIEGRGAFEVKLAVPESLPLVAIGEALTILHRDQTLTGTIREASPAADPASRTRQVVLALPAGSEVRSGQYVRVLWPVSQREQLTVPTDAVTRFGQMDRVFVAVEGRAVLRLVRPGGTEGGHTIILAGVNAGERVVREPSARLRDGQPLEIKP